MFFEYPKLLWLLLVPLLLLVLYIYRLLKGKEPHFRVSVLRPWRQEVLPFLILYAIYHIS